VDQHDSHHYEPITVDAADDGVSMGKKLRQHNQAMIDVVEDHTNYLWSYMEQQQQQQQQQQQCCRHFYPGSLNNNNHHHHPQDSIGSNGNDNHEEVEQCQTETMTTQQPSPPLLWISINGLVRNSIIHLVYLTM